MYGERRGAKKAPLCDANIPILVLHHLSPPLLTAIGQAMSPKSQELTYGAYLKQNPRPLPRNSESRRLRESKEFAFLSTLDDS